MTTKPSRQFDALYDTTYSASNAKDHFKFQRQYAPVAVEKVPAFDNLFSELPHHPAASYRLKATSGVPGHVDRTYHAPDCSPGQLAARSDPAQVSGGNTLKYYRKPQLYRSGQPSLAGHASHTTTLGAPGPHQQLHGAADASQYAAAAARAAASAHAAMPGVMSAAASMPESAGPKSRTVGTQSEYRDSEAQTGPWTPGYILPAAVTARQAALSQRNNCEGPELLQLAGMDFELGERVGAEHVAQVEALREKRAFDAALPPLDDLKRLPLRLALVQQWEAREWEGREADLEVVQQQQLELMERKILAREEEMDLRRQQRVEATAAASATRHGVALETIHAGRIKTLRHLAQARRKVDPKEASKKPSLVEQYADYGSTVYAPLQRESRSPETWPGHRSVDTAKFQGHNLQEVQALEASLPAHKLQPKIKAPQPPAKLNYSQRQEAAVQHDLETIDKLLTKAMSDTGGSRGVGSCWPAPLDSGSATKGRAGDGNLQASGSIKRGACSYSFKERPPTPEAPALALGASKQAAIILLQRLLRGRAVQQMMQEGRQRREELIRELQYCGGTTGAASYSAKPGESGATGISSSQWEAWHADKKEAVLLDAAIAAALAAQQQAGRAEEAEVPAQRPVHSAAAAQAYAGLQDLLAPGPVLPEGPGEEPVDDAAARGVAEEASSEEPEGEAPKGVEAEAQAADKGEAGPGKHSMPGAGSAVPWLQGQPWQQAAPSAGVVPEVDEATAAVADVVAAAVAAVLAAAGEPVQEAAPPQQQEEQQAELVPVEQAEAQQSEQDVAQQQVLPGQEPAPVEASDAAPAEAVANDAAAGSGSRPSSAAQAAAAQTAAEQEVAAPGDAAASSIASSRPASARPASARPATAAAGEPADAAVASSAAASAASADADADAATDSAVDAAGDAGFACVPEQPGESDDASVPSADADIDQMEQQEEPAAAGEESQLQNQQDDAPQQQEEPAAADAEEQGQLQEQQDEAPEQQEEPAAAASGEEPQLHEQQDSAPEHQEELQLPDGAELSLAGPASAADV